MKLQSSAAFLAAAVLSSGLLLEGCSKDSPQQFAAASTASPISSASSTAGTPAPARPLTQSLTRSDAVPSCPSDKPWYFRHDAPTTPDNEAARDLARVLASNGASEAAAYEHLTTGGALAIFVGGLGHERDDLSNQSGWIAPCAQHVQGTLEIPGLQVDYKDWTPTSGPLALATYQPSFVEGVARTAALVTKALSAGAGEVRLYGHSKGGDVVQETTWLHQHEPRLTYALAMGVPLWSAGIPNDDASAGRSGLFRMGVLRGRDFGGKLVVFVRRSDRVSHGALLPAGSFPGPGHDYKNVLATPGVPARFDAVGFVEPVGFADRTFGLTHDY